MKKLIIFDLWYPYGEPRVYLPVGLMNLGSRLLEAGVSVSFIDLNFERSLGTLRSEISTADVLGFSVIGPPYIPGLVRYIRALRSLGLHMPILVGGEGVARLRREDFARWFGGLGQVIQVQEDSDMFPVLSITKVRSAFETSMADMLRRLDPEVRNRYLESEFCLFLSNGCKFRCDFCAALKGREEQYRTLDSLRDEVEYICHCLAGSGKTLRLYLSNLDAFQTPDKLEACLKAVSWIAMRHGLQVEIRCLATARCTVEACAKDPDLPRRLYSYGLRTVGFGADGADQETWNRQNKKHNSVLALTRAREEMQRAGIRVEILMVFGFQGDPLSSLWNTFAFSMSVVWKGAVIRPYMAKSKTPSGRWDPDDPEVKRFLGDPELLMRLDYAAIGSKETHPSLKERWAANFVYLLLIVLLVPFDKCVTRPLFPVPKRGLWRGISLFINRHMPPDK